MKLSIIYNVFVRDFRKQKKRITLTLVALGWGTVSIMLLLGFGEGLHRQLNGQRKGMGENIIVMWGGESSIAYQGMGKGRPIYLQQEDIEYLKRKVPQLKEVGGEFSRWGVRVERDTIVLQEHVIGTTPNYRDMRNYVPQMGGRMINDRDVQLRRRVAFLGWELKERLFGAEDAVGRQVMVNSVPFTVIGVMKEKRVMGNYSGMDRDKLTMPITTFETMFGHRYLNNMVYQVHVPEDAAVLEEKVFEALGAKYKFDPTDDRALMIWDTVATAEAFDNILIGIKMFLGIIGGLTLLIAGVGVANIMYVSIKERTREIGIKMAMGARKSYILVQFLIEALIITFFGGFGGMAISYILTEAFKRVPIESDVMEMMGRPTISLEIGITVVLILGIMGVLSGLFPAMRAASVNPVESLRYE
ncbi:MAG: ABC transporter permease [Candidatus Zixiibacteriota bacterium]|nr:MAG: ABC transporter permease [candidate division Zixibacteria bacterium]